MTDRNDGGPAFPQAEPVRNEFHKDFGADRGMTLRDYFAAKAMVVLFSDVEYMPNGGTLSDRSRALFLEIAFDAYEMADAMLKARDAS